MNCIVFVQKYIFVRRLIGRKMKTRFLKFSVEELCDGRRCDGAG